VFSQGGTPLKLQKLYEFVIQEGIQADPRSHAEIKAVLKAEKKKFDKLERPDKAFFDQDRLFNPFADSRILFGDAEIDVKTVIVGIDMEVGEMLLVDRLREKGQKIDLVIGHHPDGHALANFYEVMALQANIFSKQGVPIAIAENLTRERMSEVGRSVSAANHMQTVDAARLLGVPLMCMHTPADNHVYNYLQSIFDRKNPKQLKDILDILHGQPEYQEARKRNAGPFILAGNPENQAGKILVDMTGGTEGSRDIFTRLAQNGISTIICMHLSEAHFKKAREEKINIINAGHIASDNLGINLVLDKLCKKQRLTILEASGFRRFERK
jgi:hypothetical protein